MLLNTKQRCRDIVLHSFSILSFFYLSLQCNAYVKLLSTVSQELFDLGFFFKNCTNIRYDKLYCV